MAQKINEEMWCYNCEHVWETEDYYNCHSCPNCNNEPIRIYRTSSFTCFYAMEAKQKEKDNAKLH